MSSDFERYLLVCKYTVRLTQSGKPSLEKLSSTKILDKNIPKGNLHTIYKYLQQRLFAISKIKQ